MQSAVEQLDMFVGWSGEDAPSAEYVTGFAHALLVLDIIDSARFHAVVGMVTDRVRV